MHITAILSEGPHDVAFIANLLRTSPVIKKSERTLRELPNPLGVYFSKRLERLSIGDYRLDQALAVGLPRLQAAFEADEESRIWLLLQCGGDNKKDETLSLLTDLKDIMGAPLAAAGSSSKEQVSSLSIIHVFDADSYEKVTRLSRFNENFANFYRVSLTASDNFEATAIFPAVMCCVIGGEEGVKTLEDIILPMARTRSHAVLAAIESILSDSVIAELSVADRSGSKYKKALLNIIAQLHFPGASLATAIERGGPLHDRLQISQCSKCTRIFKSISGKETWVSTNPS